MNKPKLRAIDSKQQKHVKIELEAALSADYDNVIIFGLKDGLIFTHGTRRNRLELIGALEVAKQITWGYPDEE